MENNIDAAKRPANSRKVSLPGGVGGPLPAVHLPSAEILLVPNALVPFADNGTRVIGLRSNYGVDAEPHNGIYLYVVRLQNIVINSTRPISISCQYPGTLKTSAYLYVPRSENMSFTASIIAVSRAGHPVRGGIATSPSRNPGTLPNARESTVRRASAVCWGQIPFFGPISRLSRNANKRKLLIFLQSRMDAPARGTNSRYGMPVEPESDGHPGAFLAVCGRRCGRAV